MSLTFSLKYLVNFCKAAGLSNQVKICLSNEVPLLVEYTLSGNSYLRFYLAPKVCAWSRPTLIFSLPNKLRAVLTDVNSRSAMTSKRGQKMQRRINENFLHGVNGFGFHG